jgi:hypothetical protein
MCLAPDTPGQLGQSVRLITNHLSIDSYQSTAGYRVTITLKGSPAATVTATSPAKQQQTRAISLDVRQQLLSQVAQQQGWAKDSWQYDPSSNRLFSLQALATGSVVDVQGPAGGKGRQSTYEV